MINANSPVVVVELDHNPLAATSNLEVAVTTISVISEGASAYDIWLAAGNTGTIDDFLATMLGVAGVHIGPEPPEDTTQLWIDTDDETTQVVTDPNNLLRAIFVSSSTPDPTQGKDGDIWLKYL